MAAIMMTVEITNNQSKNPIEKWSLDKMAALAAGHDHDSLLYFCYF